MSTLVDAINTARNKLLSEYVTPTRIEMSKNNARKLAKEMDIDLPENWNPKAGEKVGEVFGISIYIGAGADEFNMSGARK